MTTETITIQVDSEAAARYRAATAEEQEKLRLLLGMWLREAAADPASLKRLMTEIGERARERGLSEEVLETLLDEE